MVSSGDSPCRELYLLGRQGCWHGDPAQDPQLPRHCSYLGNIFFYHLCVCVSLCMKYFLFMFLYCYICWVKAVLILFYAFIVFNTVCKALWSWKGLKGAFEIWICKILTHVRNHYFVYVWWVEIYCLLLWISSYHLDEGAKSNKNLK